MVAVAVAPVNPQFLEHVGVRADEVGGAVLQRQADHVLQAALHAHLGDAHAVARELQAIVESVVAGNGVDHGPRIAFLELGHVDFDLAILVVDDVATVFQRGGLVGWVDEPRLFNVSRHTWRRLDAQIWCCLLCDVHQVGGVRLRELEEVVVLCQHLPRCCHVARGRAAEHRHVAGVVGACLDGVEQRAEGFGHGPDLIWRRVRVAPLVAGEVLKLRDVRKVLVALALLHHPEDYVGLE